MPRTVMYDPLTSEARSSWLAGLTEACSKLSEVLDLKTDKAVELQMNELYISETDRYRIYQTGLGTKLWLETPAPVIMKNGVVITPESDNFSIDYLGGSIAFEIGSTLTEDDVITASFTYIVGASETIEGINESIQEIQSIASSLKGYYSSYDNLIASVPSGKSGDYAIVGGTENNIYVWNQTDKKWNPVFKPTDLSKYYTAERVDNELGKKQDLIAPYDDGDDPSDDNYYYGGRKQWVSIFQKVLGTSLAGLVTTVISPVTTDDTVLQAIGKLQAQISNMVQPIIGNRAPGSDTVGKIGQDYINQSNGNKFHLVSIDEGPKYNWELYMSDNPFTASDIEEIWNATTI